MLDITCICQYPWLCDCFLYSVTLFVRFNNLTGHSDVVMGLVSINREDLYDKLKFLQNGE